MCVLRKHSLVEGYFSGAIIRVHADSLPSWASNGAPCQRPFRDPDCSSVSSSDRSLPLIRWAAWRVGPRSLGFKALQIPVSALGLTDIAGLSERDAIGAIETILGANGLAVKRNFGVTAPASFWPSIPPTTMSWTRSPRRRYGAIRRRAGSRRSMICGARLRAQRLSARDGSRCFPVALRGRFSIPIRRIPHGLDRARVR